MRRVVPLGLVLFLAACQTVPRSYRLPEGPYGEALRANTREVVIRKGFETALIGYATIDSKEFRAARAQRLADIFEVPPAEAEAKAGALAQGGPGPSFVVAIYTGSRFANELEKPSAVWGFHLKSGKGSFAPTQVIRLPHTYSVETLYPYADNFFATYRLNFAPEAANGKLVLSVAGPAGEGDFVFE